MKTAPEMINVEDFFGDKAMRWYQISAVNQSIDAIIRGSLRILIVLPTGTGKTITSASMLNHPRLRAHFGLIEGERLRVLFVANNGRLLTQAERTYAEESGVELILQSTQSDIPQAVIDEGWHITILDEAHHESMASVQYQLEHIGEHPLIGLTATPDRADGSVIKFSEIIAPISREQAVQEGYLAPTKLYSIVDGAEKDKTRIGKDILSRYAHIMNGTMVFVRTKKEIAIIVDHILELGYTAVGIVDQTANELNDVLDAFAVGDVQFLVTCMRLGEGVDVRGCTTVLLLRTIGSYPLLNQIIGRASRPDCACQVFEIVNPLSGYNLDTTCVTGIPELHTLVYHAANEWHEELFDYAA
jgi:superfamily II DNA or RNA helicase